MTHSQLLKLREAAKILKKSDLAKPCPKFCWGCFQCWTSELIKEYSSLVYDQIYSDEEMEEYMKRFEKVKKRFEVKEVRAEEKARKKADALAKARDRYLAKRR